MTYSTVLSALKVARRKKLNWIEVLFHPGRATPSEAKRWTKKPRIAQFHLDTNRYVERDSLLKIKDNLP